MANIVYRDMPAPRELSQQIPAPPRVKAMTQKSQGGDKFLVQISGDARGGMVMDEIDTCVIHILLIVSQKRGTSILLHCVPQLASKSVNFLIGQLLIIVVDACFSSSEVSDKNP